MKKYGGFQLKGTKPGMLKIIHISIDRPNILICVFLIPKGKINCYKQLYFLLDQAVKSLDSGLTP